MSAQRKQKQEYENWVANQNQARQAEDLRQQEQRKQAEAAQQAAVTQIGAKGQQEAQATEEARLKGQMAKDVGISAQPQAVPVSVADKPTDRAAGQLSGDLAKKMNE